MTFPAGPVNPYGPYAPPSSTAIAGGSSGISVIATSPGAAANVSEPTYPTQDQGGTGYNFTHAITSTQELLNGTVENVAQQGSTYLTNVTSTTLAGYAVGACSFVQTVGAYNSVK